MEDELRSDYEGAMHDNNVQVQKMVLEGLSQVENRQTKDFNEVCDRLEKKYQAYPVLIKN